MIRSLGVQDVKQPIAPTELGVNDTRYGFIPIWEVTGLHPHSFRASTLPANEVIELKLFRAPQLNEDGKFIDITPENQVRDLYNIAGGHYATDFPELAKLKDVGLINLILDELTPQTKCEQYPAQLKNQCATCWQKYLETVDTDTFAPELRKVAEETKAKLLHSLRNGLAVALTSFNDSVKQVETKKKSGLSDQDRICMMHLHKKEPNFNGAQSLDGIGAEIAKGLQGVVGNQSNGLSKSDIAEIVASAVAPLHAEIEKLKAENADLKEETCSATTNSGSICKNKAVANGFCKTHGGGDN